MTSQSVKHFFSWASSVVHKFLWIVVWGWQNVWWLKDCQKDKMSAALFINNIQHSQLHSGPKCKLHVVIQAVVKLSKLTNYQEQGQQSMDSVATKASCCIRKKKTTICEHNSWWKNKQRTAWLKKSEDSVVAFVQSRTRMKFLECWRFCHSSSNCNKITCWLSLFLFVDVFFFSCWSLHCFLLSPKQSKESTGDDWKLFSKSMTCVLELEFAEQWWSHVVWNMSHPAMAHKRCNLTSHGWRMNERFEHEMQRHAFEHIKTMQACCSFHVHCCMFCGFKVGRNWVSSFLINHSNTTNEKNENEMQSKRSISQSEKQFNGKECHDNDEVSKSDGQSHQGKHVDWPFILLNACLAAKWFEEQRQLKNNCESLGRSACWHKCQCSSKHALSASSATHQTQRSIFGFAMFWHWLSCSRPSWQHCQTPLILKLRGSDNAHGVACFSVWWHQQMVETASVSKQGITVKDPFSRQMTTPFSASLLASSSPACLRSQTPWIVWRLQDKTNAWNWPGLPPLVSPNAFGENHRSTLLSLFLCCTLRTKNWPWCWSERTLETQSKKGCWTTHLPLLSPRWKDASFFMTETNSWHLFCHFNSATSVKGHQWSNKHVQETLLVKSSIADQSKHLKLIHAFDEMDPRTITKKCNSRPTHLHNFFAVVPWCQCQWKCILCVQSWLILHPCSRRRTAPWRVCQAKWPDDQSCVRCHLENSRNTAIQLTHNLNSIRHHCFATWLIGPLISLLFSLLSLSTDLECFSSHILSQKKVGQMQVGLLTEIQIYTIPAVSQTSFVPAFL